MKLIFFLNASLTQEKIQFKPGKFNFIDFLFFVELHLKWSGQMGFWVNVILNDYTG